MALTLARTTADASSPLEGLLLKGNDDIVWCTILDHFADDAATLARFSMSSKACQGQVFASLRSVLQTAAPFSTAAPGFKTSKEVDPKLKRNDYVMPVPLLEGWWTDKQSEEEEEEEEAEDENPQKKQRMAETHGNSIIQTPTTEYDRLEGLGYYQAIVRAGLLRKKRVITNDRYSKARVPHSALRMNKMVEIASNRFSRSKALYVKRFPDELYVPGQSRFREESTLPQNAFHHDSVYEKGLEAGIIFCLAQFMVCEKILPNFNVPDPREHTNIHMHGGRKKYRECALYQKYEATVATNLFSFYVPLEHVNIHWSSVPLTLRLLVASENQTTIKW